MPRTTAERRLNSIVKNLDGEDKQQVLDLAERLADGRTAKSHDSAESLVPNDNTPSYTAATDPEEYEARKRKGNRNDHPDDKTP